MSDLAYSLGPNETVRGRVFGVGLRGWLLALLLTALAGFGAAMLYSVAGGSWEPWAERHLVRFAAALLIMLLLGLTPIRLWMAAALPFYLVSLALLVGVEVNGATVMGATRWLDIGPIRIQPSELMKPALVLALAAYFQRIPHEKVSNLSSLIPALAMIGAPVALIAKQPDLGTALLVVAAGTVVVFLSGIKWRIIIAGAIAGLAGLAALFTWGLHDYQRRRILTFLDPDNDPMGAGYHILQSKIAIGSGGVHGKGFGEGTQTQLDFLPEKHTDFIFTVIGEELGFIGGLAVLGLAAAVLIVGVSIALSCKNVFGRLASMGVCATFAGYVFINTAMVMGLVPVVGVPFPLVSNGGSVMFAVMASFGVVLSAHVYRDTEITRRGRGLF